MKHILLITISIFLFACSSDDDGGVTPTGPINQAFDSTIYFGDWVVNFVDNPSICPEQEFSVVYDTTDQSFYMEIPFNRFRATLDSNIFSATIGPSSSDKFVATFESSVFGRAEFTNGSCVNGVVRRN